ncbi:hypothetical protein Tco_0563413 [Tanacetum coccineum]
MAVTLSSASTKLKHNSFESHGEISSFEGVYEFRVDLGGFWRFTEPGAKPKSHGRELATNVEGTMNNDPDIGNLLKLCDLQFMTSIEPMDYTRTPGKQEDHDGAIEVFRDAAMSCRKVLYRLSCLLKKLEHLNTIINEGRKVFSKKCELSKWYANKLLKKIGEALWCTIRVRLGLFIDRWVENGYEFRDIASCLMVLYFDEDENGGLNLAL